MAIHHFRCSLDSFYCKIFLQKWLALDKDKDDATTSTYICYGVNMDLLV
jgi:hypothetical protein